MKIVAMIPARLGSKRVPKKNLRLLCGRPLISYNIETAVKSGLFDEVYVNSEAEIFSKIAKQYCYVFHNRILALLQKKQKKVIEIASNDGTFLRPFQENGDTVIQRLHLWYHNLN